MSNSVVNQNFQYSPTFARDEDKSALESVSDFLQFGVSSAAVSAGLGIYNTVASVGNMLGGDSEILMTSDVLRSAGLDETADYYDEHTTAIDAVGFIAGSFVPGLSAVKALRVGQEALATAKTTSRLSTGFRKALLPDNRLAAMREEIKTKGVDAFGAINQNKLRAIAAGVHQQALEAAAFEGAVLLTMNKNPSLDTNDLNYLESIQANLGLAGAGLLFGTALGGTFEAVRNVGLLNKEFKEYMLSKGIPETDLKAMGLENIISAGDTATVAAQDYLSAKSGITSPDFATLAQGERANLLKREQTAKATLQHALLKVANNDPELRDRLFNLLESGKVDHLELLSGVDRYRPMYQQDLLFDVPSSQVDFLNEGEVENWLRQLYSAAGREIPTPEAIKADVSSFLGAAASKDEVSMIEALGTRGVVNLDEMLKDGNPEIWNNLFTFRHESGHVFLNYRADQIKAKSPYGRRLITEMEKVSRLARPEDWRNLDMMKSISDPSPFILAARDELEQYLMNPRELLADSFGYLNDPTRFDLATVRKEYQSLYNLMVGNKALAGMFRKGKRAINLETGKLSPNGISPTAADMSSDFKLVKDNVHYGKGEVAKLGEKFDYKTTNALKANALHSVAAIRKDIKPNSTLDFYDIPALTAAKIQNIPVTVTRDGVNVRDLYTSMDDLILHSKIETVEALRRESMIAQELKRLKTGKSRILKRIENDGKYRIVTKDQEVVDESIPRRILTTSEIARIADVGTEFVHRASAYARTFDPALGASELPANMLNYNRDLPFFSIRDGYDPMKPTHAILQADYRAVVDNNRLKGLSDLQSRVKVIRQSIDSAFAAYTKNEAQNFPDAAYLTGYNAAKNVTPVDSTSGIVTSANQEVGSGGSVFQYMGQQAARVMSKKEAEVKATFDSIKVRIAQDNDAVYEAAVLDSILRQTPSKMEYHFVPELDEWLSDLQQARGDAINDDVFQALDDSGLLDAIFNKAADGKTIWRGELRRPLEDLVVNGEDYEEAYQLATNLLDNLKNTKHEIQSDLLAEFWRTMVRYNGEEIVTHKNALGARVGANVNIDHRALYPGPADTTTYPHHALVVVHEKGLMGMQDAGMIVAKDSADLQRKIADLKSQFTSDQLEVFTKNNIEKYKKAEGTYQNARLFRDSTVNSMLTRKGVLWDVAPQPNPGIFNQYTNSLVSQHRGLTRGMIEAKYSEEFSTLQQGSEWLSNFNSRVGRNTKERNVFSDMMDMALNRHPESEGNLWSQINTITDKAISTAYYTLIGTGRTAAATGDWEKMNQLLEKYGMQKVYNEANQLLLTNVDAPKPLLGKITSKMNFIVGTSMLRMDSAHALVNIMSLPIMLNSEFSALKRFASKDALQVLTDGTSVTIPGSPDKINSMLPLVHQAIKDFFQKKDLVELYRSRGLLNTTLEDIKQAEENFSKVAQIKDPKKIDEMLTSVVDTISKPSDSSEQFVKFVSARVADLVTDTLRVPAHMKWSTINSFVTRVNGNYLASQRPTLFQGWLGQAVGLFQTYQFNLLQSLFSNVKAGDKRAVANMLGLQAGIFGVQSVPGFQMMNQYIGERSVENNDFYRSSNNVLGETASNWLMYGLASSATVPVFGNGIDLYSRGDLTPRTPILLPTSFEEIPAISITSKFASSVLGAAKNLTEGTPVVETMLDALAHSGLNRPLMGIAQLMQGERTTASGQVLVDLDGWDTWNLVTRALGSKPLDEAVAVSSFYRANSYKAARQDALDSLGKRYRLELRAEGPTNAGYMDAMREYTRLGGNVDSFQRWAGNNLTNATQSQIDDMRRQNESPEGRYLQEVMGAKIEDNVGDYTGIY